MCDRRGGQRFGLDLGKDFLGRPAVGIGNDLPRLVGRGRALDLLLTGRTIDAAEALRIGLVEYVFPEEEFLARVLEIAAQIAAHPASAVGASKHCVNAGLRDGIEAGLAQERRMRVETGTGPDAVEGRNAFLEKREPRFNQT